MKHQSRRRGQLSVVLTSLSAQFAVCLDLICQIISTSHHMLLLPKLIGDCTFQSCRPLPMEKERKEFQFALLTVQSEKEQNIFRQSVQDGENPHSVAGVSVMHCRFSCFVDTIYAGSSCHSQGRLSQKCRS